MDDYRALSLNPPSSVPWTEVVDFARLDERRSCVDCLYANILGVNTGEVEWCPNEEPPSRDEKLAWLWFIRPDLAPEIQTDASAELRRLMESYENNMMDSWWKEITQ
jgi:hypothetical protein